MRNQICPVCEYPAVDGYTHPKCLTRYTPDGLTSFFRYRGPVRNAIKSIKYRLVSDIADDFINLIPTASYNDGTMKQLNNKYVLIPIPLHPSRLCTRGFNQSEVLGKIMAKRLNIPVNTYLLKRVRKTVPQVEMTDRKKRLINMANVFSVNHLAMKPFNHENVLLFDDVFTTGATLRSAANALKRTGVKRVWGITLAHG